MTKRFMFVLALFAAGAFSLYAQSAALFGKKDVSVVKTRWFDIIYPAESAATAAILVEHADGLYERASAVLSTTPPCRMPLVITRVSDVMNAYYTPSPYNRIVVYDTLPDYSLSAHQDTLLSIVYHEMIHAVSLNQKSPFMKAMSTVFGDILNPARILNLPLSFIEGITVGNEALNNDGRTNDDYSMHLLRQAKLEGKFPAWDDVTGFRDTYPSGSLPYLFGGAFSVWLEQEYGMEKYASFWRMSNHVQFFKLVPTIFSDVYGVTLKNAWQRFEATVNVPNIPAKPEELAGITRLFDKNGIYGSVTSSPAGVVWGESASGDVFLQSGDAKPKKLLSLMNGSRASFSADGNYLALSYVIAGNGTVNSVNRVAVYDMRTKHLVDLNADSLRDATVVTIDGMRYLCAVRVQSQQASLVYYPFDTGTKTLKFGSEAESRRVDFPRTTIPFSPVDAGNGLTAFVCKEQGVWSVALLNMATGDITYYDTPSETMRIHELNAAQDEHGVSLAFSWTDRGTLPRAGILRIAADGEADPTAIWQLLEADFSGGIYSPALVDGNTLIYTARFYENGAVYSAALDSDAIPAFTETAAVSRTHKNAPVSDAGYQTLTAAKKYHPIRYWTDGILMPFPLIGVYEYTTKTKTIDLPWALPWGITYITNDPGEQNAIQISLGVDNFSESGGFNINLSGGKNIFSYSLWDNTLFTTGGFDQNMAGVSLSSSFMVGKNSALTFRDTAEWFLGYENPLPLQRARYSYSTLINTAADAQTLVPEPNVDAVGDLINVVTNLFQVSFSTIRQRGLGHYNRGGISITPRIRTEWVQHLNEPWYTNAELTFGARLPRLLPFTNSSNMTFNLPFSLQASLFPSRTAFVSAGAAIVPFSLEIQKGLWPALFLRRISLTASYTAFLSRENDSWDIARTVDIIRDGGLPFRDNLTLSLFAVTGYNVAIFIQMPFELGADFVWNLHRAVKDSPFEIKLHFTASF